MIPRNQPLKRLDIRKQIAAINIAVASITGVYPGGTEKADEFQQRVERHLDEITTPPPATVK